MHAASKAVDRWIGGLLVLLFAPFSRCGAQREGAAPSRILVVRLWTLGETLLTAPLVAELRQRFPAAEITILCRRANRPVIEMFPGVDGILLFEADTLFALLRSFRRFDLAVDTEPWFRVSALLSFWLARRRIGFSHGVRRRLYTDRVDFDDRQYEAQTFLDLLRPLGARATFFGFPALRIPSGEEEAALRLLEGLPERREAPAVGMCPGAEDALYRMWPAERFAQAADALAEAEGAWILLVGSPSEREVCGRVAALMRRRDRVRNLAGTTTLPGLFALLRRLDLLVTNDTGPMHAAAAVGTPTVALFGPNLPVRFAPRTPHCAVIFHGDEDNPVIDVHRGKIPAGNKPAYGASMRRITVDEVVAAARALLRRAGTRGGAGS